MTKKHRKLEFDAIERLTSEVSKKLFEHLQDQMHSVDDQAAEQGVDDPALFMMLTVKMAILASSYAAYTCAGVYAVSGDKKLGDGATDAMLDDITAAVRDGKALGYKRAKAILDEDKKKEQDVTDAVQELLKRAAKKCH